MTNAKSTWTCQISSVSFQIEKKNYVPFRGLGKVTKSDLGSKMKINFRIRLQVLSVALGKYFLDLTPICLDGEEVASTCNELLAIRWGRTLARVLVEIGGYGGEMVPIRVVGGISSTSIKKKQYGRHFQNGQSSSYKKNSTSPYIG